MYFEQSSAGHGALVNYVCAQGPHTRSLAFAFAFVPVGCARAAWKCKWSRRQEAQAEREMPVRLGQEAEEVLWRVVRVGEKQQKRRVVFSSTPIKMLRKTKSTIFFTSPNDVRG